MFREGPWRLAWEHLGLGKPEEGAPEQISLQAVRKEGSLRLEALGGVEKTNAAYFTDSQVHPVSTRLPQAPLCLGCFAKTSPAKLKIAITRHKPPPAFLGTRAPDF